MDNIRQYLLSIVAAAVIAALAVSLVDKKSTHAAIIKLLASVFLSITVISPWTKIQFDDLSSYFDSLELSAGSIAEEGSNMASKETAAIISSRMEAYILDKASSLGFHPEVTVVLTESPPYTPCSVTLRGTASPYAKNRLQQIILNDLGIPEEEQSWN